MLKWFAILLAVFLILKFTILPPIFFVAFRYIFLGLFVFWIFRFILGIRAILKGIRIEKIDLNQQNSGFQTREIYRNEKDISEQVRVLEEENKKLED